MSDRGYRALGLQVMAQAIQVEIDGMKQHNTEAEMSGAGNFYQQPAFDEKAAELKEISETITLLVGVKS